MAKPITLQLDLIVDDEATEASLTEWFTVVLNLPRNEGDTSEIQSLENVMRTYRVGEKV